MSTERFPLLVTGGSGRFAAMVIDSLLNERHVAPGDIIVTTRRPEQLSRYSARGVEVRQADFDKPEGLAGAFAGARRMLIIPTADVDRHGRRVRQHEAAVDAAKAAGVGHICYVSSPAPEPGTPCFWEVDHYMTEQAIKASGLSWSMLRNYEQVDWHVLNDWGKALERGVRYAASGDARCAYVAQRDCAQAAAAALDSDSTENRTFAISGPQALTVDESMEILGEVGGREIRVEHVSPNEMRQKVIDYVPAELLADAMVALDQGILDGSYAPVTGDFEELIGRPATTLRDYLRELGVGRVDATAGRGAQS